MLTMVRFEIGDRVTVNRGSFIWIEGEVAEVRDGLTVVRFRPSCETMAFPDSELEHTVTR
jgi:transcription elongation factor